MCNLFLLFSLPWNYSCSYSNGTMKSVYTTLPTAETFANCRTWRDLPAVADSKPQVTNPPSSEWHGERLAFFHLGVQRGFVKNTTH